MKHEEEKNKRIKEVSETGVPEHLAPIKLKAGKHVIKGKGAPLQPSLISSEPALEPDPVLTQEVTEEEELKTIEIKHPRRIFALTSSKKQKPPKVKKGSVQEPSFSKNELDLYLLQSGRSSLPHKGESKAKVPLYPLVVFTQQLATMLNAGIALTRIFQIFALQSENAVVRSVSKEIYKDLLKGQSLSNAMQQFPKVFSSTYVATVMAAETSGTVSETMKQLASNLERENVLVSKVKSALTYPVVVVVFAIVTFVLLMSYVLPVYFDFYRSLNIELPMITRVVMFVFELPRNPVFLISLITLLLLCWKVGPKMLSQPHLRLVIDRWFIKIPFLGKIIKKLIMARFCRGFGIMSAAGVNHLTVLDILRKSVNNLYFALLLYNLIDDIRSGMTISEGLKKTLIFPSLVVNLVSVGEESGDLNRMMLKAADFFEQDLDHLLNNIATILEPFLMLVLGVIVGTIVVSLFVPLYGILSQLR